MQVFIRYTPDKIDIIKNGTHTFLLVDGLKITGRFIEHQSRYFIFCNESEEFFPLSDIKGYYPCINDDCYNVVSSVEYNVIQKIGKRAEIGASKYGATMERNDLKYKEWVQHAQEESLDFCNYLEKLLQL